MNVHQTLQKIGLRTQETRVYLALLELQESTTGPICKTACVERSDVYSILDSLMRKGLVSYRIQNNIKVFMPSPPSALNELFLKKQTELEEQRKILTKVVTSLKKRTSSPKPEYKYYEGISGIKSLWLEISEIMKPNTTAMTYTGVVESFELLNAFYLDFHKKRIPKKVKEQMILPTGATTFAQEREKIGLIDVRYLDLDNQAEFATFPDFVVLQCVGKDVKIPRGFLISDPLFAQMFRSIFKRLWKQAKN